MFSLSERKALELAAESKTLFIRHTQRQLVRIYPAGSRTNSSNYSPFPFWFAGCQIVGIFFGPFTSFGNVIRNDALSRRLPSTTKPTAKKWECIADSSSGTAIADTFSNPPFWQITLRFRLGHSRRAYKSASKYESLVDRICPKLETTRIPSSTLTSRWKFRVIRIVSVHVLSQTTASSLTGTRLLKRLLTPRNWPSFVSPLKINKKSDPVGLSDLTPCPS